MIHPKIIKRDRDARGIPGKTHPLHRAWRNMRYRCTNPNCDSWSNYGGRGIFVDSVWDDFSEFYLWSVGNGWMPGLELDRIDNEREYSPSNCRWVNSTVNQNNKRNSVRYLYRGESLTAGELFDMLSPLVGRATFHARLKDGWNIDEAATKGRYEHR